MKIENFNDIKSFLFNNLNTRQTIFKNTFWLAIAEGITKLLKLILFIYVARILGATEYGRFSFAFAFVYLFALLADWGVGEIVIREFAQEKEKEKEFPSIISLKILLNLGTLILVFLSSLFITPNHEIQKLIWILAFYLSIDSFFYIFCCFFRARQQMQYEAFAKIIQAVMLVAAGFFTLFKFPSAQSLSYSYLFAVLISLIFILLIFLLKAYPLKIEWNKLVWRRYLMMSWPLAFVGTMTMIYSQIDSVMMGYWNQITETGWYNAAYTLVGAVLMISGFISLSFYPALSKYFKESKETLQKIWNSQVEIMIFLAVPLVAGGFVLAHQIINFVFDSSYLPAVLTFQILIIMAGIAFLQSPFNHILIAAGQQKKLFLATFLGTAVNVVLNFILIPKFSLNGAAAATVFTWLILLLFCARFTHLYTPLKIFNLRFLWAGILSLTSAFIMYLAILDAKAHNLHLLLSVLIGAMVYPVIFFVLKFITKKLNYAYVEK